jgi:hypothetical protein
MGYILLDNQNSGVEFIRVRSVNIVPPFVKLIVLIITIDISNGIENNELLNRLSIKYDGVCTENSMPLTAPN